MKLYTSPWMKKDDQGDWTANQDTWPLRWLCRRTLHRLFEIPRKAIRLRLILYDRLGPDRLKARDDGQALRFEGGAIKSATNTTWLLKLYGRLRRRWVYAEIEYEILE